MTKIFGSTLIIREQATKWYKFYAVRFKLNKVKMHDSLIFGKNWMTSESDFFDIGK